ncbi:hypothetical protein O181_002690 [Austropuccinia psidii MF-1]|uniref:Reverse transcriptase domain-containing protein n=1 Tax=Austropuccinia psidii MF-1 TaxID=1389203 RepID=A0A9Q3BDH8_9BASI|nr:hypothetical protein [Austropuccinia psidii MF-1]
MKSINLDGTTFIEEIQNVFARDLQSNIQQTKEKIEDNAEGMRNTLKEAYLKQGKWVNANTNKSRSWWDKKVLNPIVKQRNRARRLMLLTRSDEANKCYQQWQQIFKTKVKEFKINHWREFLATNGPNHSFDAFRFTKTRASGEVHPLRNLEGKLTNDKQEKDDLFFKMFSQAGTPIEETEEPTVIANQTQTFQFEKITTDKLCINIKQLPNKKSPGPDLIPNELIKIACNLIIDKLTYLFNNFLATGHFLTPWKRASTIIIQKTHKSDYSDPSTYRPIALLNTLSKLFERILNNQIMYWAHKTGAISEGHFGGRKARNIEEAMILLDSWIKEKWRKAIIHSFLQTRHMELKLDDFVSQMKLLERGLPQGSPLSVTLYLLYNSELIGDKTDTNESDQLYIGYINDVTHLVAADTTLEATRDMENLVRWTVE